MRRTTYPLALLLAGLLSATAPGLPEEPDATAESIEGSYAVSGVNRDQSTYGGTVEISHIGSVLYWLEWHDEDDSYTGKGAKVGDELFVVWGSDSAECAAVFFEYGDGELLEGFWFQAQDNGLESSSMAATPLPGSAPVGIEGRYSVDTGELAGSGFPSELRITDLGEDYFHFRWEGDQPREGIGQLDSGQIQVVVSIADSEGYCGKSQMILQPDGNLSGTWMMTDEDYRLIGYEEMARQERP